MNIEFENVNCDLCNSNNFEHELTGIDREFNIQGDFTLSKCKNCGLLQLNPRPATQSIELIYPKTYGFYNTNLKPWWIRIISSIIKLKNSSTPSKKYPYLNNKTGRILDVGCSTGFTVYPYEQSGSLIDLKQKGWDAYGCEISKEAAIIGQRAGLNIKIGKLEEVEFEENFFDVIRFNHVLEHSFSPMKDLQKAKKLLKKDGIIIISGPNINSLDYFLFKEYWSGLDLPRHFYQFTPEILKKYINELGLKTVSESFDGISDNFLHSFKHLLHSKLFWNENKVCSKSDVLMDIYTNRQKYNLLSKALNPVSEFLNERKLGDCYTIIAQKNLFPL